MATLVLTAVGTAVAGPLGGAFGALVGQQADSLLFAPKPRQGPRLGDLAVQTSSYGVQIPKIFGRMRVAGTVIWAMDLREERSTSGGSKGRPATVSYSYSASFAVALSARPIRRVGRIWAEGKLLRGAGGDFKSRTGFRLYLGDEAQEVDPLIAAAEGRQAPAYRGIAYAVFEDLELADYGNRIPSLTFEVEADEGPVAVGALAAELSGGAVAAGDTPALGGYAASGDSVRGALEALTGALPLTLTEEAARLTIGGGGGEPLAIGEADLCARLQIERRAAAAVPRELSLAYYDPARDFQAGLQRAHWDGGGRRAERVVLPAALGAAEAKLLAARKLAALWAERTTAKLRLPLRLSGIRPGALVRLEGQPGSWRVRRWTLGEAGMAVLDLARIAAGQDVAGAADPGRPVPTPDLRHGPTTLLLFDLPLHDERPAERPRLFALAGGVEAGWRGAELMASYDQGASWAAAGRAVPAAAMGWATTAPGPAGSTLMDRRHSVEVELLNDSMWLEARSDDALVGGANLAVLGGELFQFGEVEPLGGRRFRLGRLLRGRRGTEWAAAAHGAGEPFALVEAEAMTVIEPATAVIGGEARLLASGPGDEEGVAASRMVSGEAVRPPAPVHLAAERLANGDIAVRWVRRSRSGWTWLSGSDTPLGEEAEAYRLRIIGLAFERAATLSAPAYIYSVAEQAADGLTGQITIEVCQIGTFASSRPSSIIFSGE